MSDKAEIVRGEQAKKPLNVAIVGAGKACYNLLHILDEERLSRLSMKIMGVADKNSNAPGILYAKEINLFTTDNFKELYRLEGLNLIIELTGSLQLREELLRTKPKEMSAIDHRGARLLWDLVQTEVEKTELERERVRSEERQKKQIQVILDSLPYRVMVVNLDMTIDTVNQTFLRDFKVTRQEAIGNKCYVVRYGLDEACWKSGTACILEKGGLEDLKKKGLFTTMKEYVDSHGNSHYDVITIAPILDEKGDIIQILETSRDVTGRIRTMTGTA